MSIYYGKQLFKFPVQNNMCKSDGYFANRQKYSGTMYGKLLFEVSFNNKKKITIKKASKPRYLIEIY